MPPSLKAKPKPVARHRAVSAAEASGEASQPSTGTVTLTTEAAEPTPSTPITPPPGRLDSLASLPRPPVGAVRGGSGSLKFKPKAIPRKTKEERDAIAAKFEASATPAPYDYKPRGGRGSRGARGGRGGRGGRGDDNFRHAPTTASGPFALGSVDSGRRKEGAVERGVDFTKHRQSLGPNQARLGKKSRMKSEDLKELNYSSSGDSDDAKVDIEFIGYLDEHEGKIEDEGGNQDMGGDDDKPWGAGAPLRVPRSQHLELKSSVNTDSSSKTDKGVKKGKSKVEFEESVKIKYEPLGEDEDIALLDFPSTPSSISSRKTKSDSGVLRQQFEEEFKLEEQDRLVTLREMVGDFSGVIIAEGNVEMKRGIKSLLKPGNIELDNQIFRFQFPEILPQLVSTVNAETKVEVEPELDENVTKAPPPPPNAPVSLKQQKLSEKAQQALLESFPPSGVAGKLRVHRSGRITILWGPGDEQDSSIQFDVTRGSTMGFLQEAVIIKQISPWGEQDVDEKGKQKGAAFSLGQVKGRFVVCPDFTKLIEAGETKKKREKGKSKVSETIQKVGT